MLQGAFVVDSVHDLLIQFDGSENQVSMIRRAILRETAKLPLNHDLRADVEIFGTDVSLLGLSVRIGNDAENLGKYLIKKWLDISTRIGRAVLH
jgi:hypothetical protein